MDPLTYEPNLALTRIATKLTWLVARRNIRELLTLCMTAEEPAARIRPDLVRAALKVPGENEALQHWSETGEWIVATDLDGELGQLALELFEYMEGWPYRPLEKQAARPDLGYPRGEPVEAFHKAMRAYGSASPILINLARKLGATYTPYL